MVSTSGEAIMVAVGKLLSHWPMGGPLVAEHWWHLVATGCIIDIPFCQTYITQMIIIIYCHIYQHGEIAIVLFLDNIEYSYIDYLYTSVSLFYRWPDIFCKLWSVFCISLTEIA